MHALALARRMHADSQHSHCFVFLSKGALASPFFAFRSFKNPHASALSCFNSLIFSHMSRQFTQATAIFKQRLNEQLAVARSQFSRGTIVKTILARFLEAQRNRESRKGTAGASNQRRCNANQHGWDAEGASDARRTQSAGALQELATVADLTRIDRSEDREKGTRADDSTQRERENSCTRKQQRAEHGRKRQARRMQGEWRREKRER
jgi:hypothetical protein